MQHLDVARLPVSNVSAAQSLQQLAAIAGDSKTEQMAAADIPESMYVHTSSKKRCRSDTAHDDAEPISKRVRVHVIARSKK